MRKPSQPAHCWLNKRKTFPKDSFSVKQLITSQYLESKQINYVYIDFVCAGFSLYLFLR